MKYTLLITSLLFVWTRCFASQTDTYAAIAGEMFDDKKYSLAIEKCAKVLSGEPEHAGCKSITDKSKQALASIEASKKQEEDLAKANTLKEKLAEETRQKKENERERAEQIKYKTMLSSPEYNNKKVCACLAAEIYYQSRIAEENKISNISGVKRLDTLRAYGERMRIVQKAGAYYREKSGSNLDQIKCPPLKKGSELLYGTCIDGISGDVIY